MSISAAEYQRRLKIVNKITVLQSLAYDVIIKEDKTIRLLKEQDYLEGDIYGNDTRIAYQSQVYSAFKYSLNPRAGGAVDLMLSGDFVDAMFVKKMQQNRYTFGNTDFKKNLLSGKYGQGIFGLNQDVFDKFQKEILAPRYVRLIKNTANIA